MNRKGSQIEFYEVDVDLATYSLNEASIDEGQLASCDLVLCQNYFGVPFAQDALFQLGQRFGIPVIEDCVQSGSLLSRYHGHQLADVHLWSGGLDKTPCCFGGGFGRFRDTEHGNALYEALAARNADLAVESWRDRAVAVTKQWLHFIVAKNYFCFISMVVLFFGRKLHSIALSVRGNGKMRPFGWMMKRPSIYQLLSMRYGLGLDYSVMANRETTKRRLLIESVPELHRTSLFPWWTPDTLRRMDANKGLSVYTWVYSKEWDREPLLDFLSERGFIGMANTTWVPQYASDEMKKTDKGLIVCQHMNHLPNLHELSDQQIVNLGKALTEYCQSV